MNSTEQELLNINNQAIVTCQQIKDNKNLAEGMEFPSLHPSRNWYSMYSVIYKLEPSKTVTGII